MPPVAILQPLPKHMGVHSGMRDLWQLATDRGPENRQHCMLVAGANDELHWLLPHYIRVARMATRSLLVLEDVRVTQDRVGRSHLLSRLKL